MCLSLFVTQGTTNGSFCKSKKSASSIDQILQTIRSCQACSECQPQFYRSAPMNLTKVTQPFERLIIDFKAPLPITNQNRYILTISDECSIFPFAYPSWDISANTTLTHLRELISIFGMPASIHSDRVKAFMSQEFKGFSS